MSFTLQPNGAYDSHAGQILTLYRPGGAAQYMSELTAALAACPLDQAGLSYAVDATHAREVPVGDQPWYELVVNASRPIRTFGSDLMFQDHYAWPACEQCYTVNQ